MTGHVEAWLALFSEVSRFLVLHDYNIEKALLNYRDEKTGFNARQDTMLQTSFQDYTALYRCLKVCN